MRNRIREELQKRGLTQKEVAEAIGMSEIGFSKACDGSATRATLDKVAEYLRVDAEGLVTEEPKPKAKYEGELQIGEKTLTCAVLDNGMRVLTASAIFEAFDRPRKGKSSESYRVDRMPSFINANNLQPFVDEQLEEWTRLVAYNDINGCLKYGYNARVLRGLCKVYIDARNAGALHSSQARFATIAESLLYALSDIGIIALVDEATGYNKAKTRAKDELQKFLQSFLREEAAGWVKRFPDTFFEDIYRMRGWTWDNTSRRPGVVGTIIRDLVYDRIGPMVRHELERLNPKNDHGNRRAKHHQFLTEIGNTKLSGHLEALHAMAILSNHEWPKFMAYIDKTYPKQYQQMSLFEPEDY